MSVFRHQIEITSVDGSDDFWSRDISFDHGGTTYWITLEYRQRDGLSWQWFDESQNEIAEPSWLSGDDGTFYQDLRRRNLEAINAVVSDDILIYNLIEESWMKQMFLVHEAALKGDLSKIEDERSIRKVFHALENTRGAVELKNKMYHEMQVRHLITKKNTRESSNIIIALDTQMFSLEPIGICESCRTPQKLSDHYATQYGLFICVNCVNNVVKSLIIESVAQGHTELVENQFRTYLLVDLIYEPNFYQFDAFMWNFFNIEWLNVVMNIFKKTILGAKPDEKGIHYFAYLILRELLR